jgi:hypothetical protein
MLRGSVVRRVLGAAVVALLLPGAGMAQSDGDCACDCDGNGVVSVGEVIMGVNIALGKAAMGACMPADHQPDGQVMVDELVDGVDALIRGCNCPADAPSFSSTWEGIQKTIFERHGCTQDICHGSTAQAGLDLRADAAYADLIDVESTYSTHHRVEPGEAERSFLWLKLAAKTDPDAIPNHEPVPGAPMPQIGDALSTDELELIRLWINDGAPDTGTVMGTEEILGACLPPPVPITIKPLDPPAQNEGIQFVMPPWDLGAHSEHEVCFATYYDFTGQIPAEFLTPNGKSFYFNTQELRQDPQSHHLILNRYTGDDTDVYDTDAFGNWTCRGGALAGQDCDPLVRDSCGDGICTSKIEESFACVGFGPGFGFNRVQIGGAQQAQALTEYYPGVYAALPIKGVLFWNSHAFNLTDVDHAMNGRLNYYFASEREFLVNGIFDTSMIFSANAPPFTSQTLCNVSPPLPRYARVFGLSSHTHKHGKHFTIALSDGTQVYESFVYNDPLNAQFDPPLGDPERGDSSSVLLNSANSEDRRLHYCSTYNNGEGIDGSPDVDLVTRASRVPRNAPVFSRCTPTACVAGKIGASCSKDSDCDSAENAGDGWCDACRITGGESTENEMFILIGQYFVDPPAN